MQTRTGWISAALLLAALASCDLGERAQSAPGPCREFGAQCKLDAGPLGVCESRSCGDGEAPPCFACTPQH